MTSSCSKTVCISGKQHRLNVLHEEEEENEMEQGKKNRMAHSIQLPFNYRSMPVHRPLFLNGHPLYGQNGGTFY